jgi:hypothetical protein
MKNQALIIFLSLLLQHIAVSQTYDSITISEGKNLALERCYLCVGMIVNHDSNTRRGFRQVYGNDSNYCITYITGYLIGDTIQKIIERIELHVKYEGEPFYDNSEILITYIFYHGKLKEAEDINSGANYRYFFKNDSLTNESYVVDDLGYFALEASEALTFSKEDENMIRNSEAFIKRRH